MNGQVGQYTLVHALLFSYLGLYRALSGGMTVVPSFEAAVLLGPP